MSGITSAGQRFQMKPQSIPQETMVSGVLRAALMRPSRWPGATAYQRPVPSARAVRATHSAALAMAGPARHATLQAAD
jgi:hypothetical protein